MDAQIQAQIAKLGRGNVKAVLHVATLLFEGWEMDNKGWIVEFEDGTRAAFTTSHGNLCEWTRSDAEERLAETERSAASIRKALEFLSE